MDTIDSMPFSLRLELAAHTNELFKRRCVETSKDFDKTYDCTGLADFRKQIDKSLMKDVTSIMTKQ
jgi:hypothetical protein